LAQAVQAQSNKEHVIGSCSGLMAVSAIKAPAFQNAGTAQTPRLKRMGTELRKETLGNVGRHLAADSRRCRGNVALLGLGTSRIANRANPHQLPWPDTGSAGATALKQRMDSSGPESVQHFSMIPADAKPSSAQSYGERVGSAGSELDHAKQHHPDKADQVKNLYHQETLEESFNSHVRTFEDGEDDFDVDEMISFLSTTHIFDEWLTPRKVKTYFASLSEGFTADAYHNTKEAFDPMNIGFKEFVEFLHFAADMKGITFSEMEDIIVEHFRTHCDKSSTMKWRLEVAFQAFGKAIPGRINASEFSNMCSRTGCIVPGKFEIADAHIMFHKHGTQGVDFDGCMDLLGQAGDKLGIGKLVYKRIAEGLETLDNDEFVVLRMRLNLKAAAFRDGHIKWIDLFNEIDPDGSASISWSEFRDMCRNKLQVTATDWDLRMLFRKLDYDQSGELSIQELVDFIIYGVVANPNNG